MSLAPCLVILWTISPALPAQQAESATPTPNARVVALLKPLETAASLRFRSQVRNLLYEERLRRAGPAARERLAKRHRFWGLRDRERLVWVADEAQAADGKEPERHVLAHDRGRWVLKEPGGTWLSCPRPTGVWHSAWLPDPGHLASVLSALPGEARWEIVVESIDDKPVRVYRLRLEGKVVRDLVTRGVIPDSADVTSGMGTIGRTYLGRTLRVPERRLEVRIYEDTKQRVPARFVLDVYQDSATTAGGRLTALGAPPPDDAAEAKPRPALSAEIVVESLGEAAPEILDETARRMLGAR